MAPGAQGDKPLIPTLYDFPPVTPATIRLFANAEVRDVPDVCSIVTTFTALTPGAPPLPAISSCPELTQPFSGPAILAEMPLHVPTAVPENSIYRVDVQIGFKSMGPDGQMVPIQTHSGYLTVRTRPFIRGDLVDDGKGDILDALRSIRLLVGLVAPTPYDWAAGDFDRDGRLTLNDTMLISRKWVIGPL